MVAIADLFASSHQTSDNACLDVLWVVGLVVKVPVSVSWFTVDLSHDSAIVLYIEKATSMVNWMDDRMLLMCFRNRLIHEVIVRRCCLHIKAILKVFCLLSV